MGRAGSPKDSEAGRSLPSKRKSPNWRQTKYAVDIPVDLMSPLCTVGSQANFFKGLFEKQEQK
jgi:hypothetical protein